jgi:hypothetical protein
MKYRVIFRGKINKNSERSQVVQKLALALKTDQNRIRNLFSGKSTVIRQNATLQSCQQLKAVFDKAGAICRIEPQKTPGENHEQRMSSDVPVPMPPPCLEAKIFSGTIRTGIQTLIWEMAAAYLIIGATLPLRNLNRLKLAALHGLGRHDAVAKLRMIKRFIFLGVIFVILIIHIPPSLLFIAFLMSEIALKLLAARKYKLAKIKKSWKRFIPQRAATEEYKRKLEEAKGEVNKMVANADGEYRRAKIEADVYFEKQELIAEAIKTEGIATAKGIQEMNNAMAGSGGEALVKLRIAEAIQGKKIVLLPVSEGGMNLKTTDINRLIETMGIKALSKKQ